MDLTLIKRFEGCKLQAYRDGGGVWTIGYGHTLGVREGMEISQDAAEMLLLSDVEVASVAVELLVKSPLTAKQREALVSFTFNLGYHALQDSTLLQRLNSEDYNSVPAEMMRWVHDNGVVVPGLVNRRKAECELWSAA